MKKPKWVLFAVLALTTPVACWAQGSPGGFDGMLQGFLAERDRLLMSPSATVADYRALLASAGTSLNPASLSAEQLARAARLGLFDSGPARKAAAARATELQAPPDATGALAATARLRIEGAHSVEAPAEGTDVPALVKGLMEHPGLDSAWKSPATAEIVDALVAGGTDAALAPYAARITSLVTTLDPNLLKTDQVRIADAALLVTLGTPQRSAFEEQMRALVAVGKSALVGLPTPPAHLERDVAALESLLREPKVVDYFAGDPRLQKEGGIKGILRRGGADFTAAVHYYLFSAYSAARLNGLTETTFINHTPPYETVVNLGPDYYSRPGRTAARAADAVVTEKGLVRVFGKTSVSDSVLSFGGSNVGFDSVNYRGFANGLSLQSGAIGASAASAVLDGRNATLTQMRAKFSLGPIPLASAVADQAVVEGNSFLAKRPKLSLFGIPITHIPDVSISLKETEDRKKSEGKSPLSQWLKMPGVSVFEGGLALKYSNAVKFSGKWTGLLKFGIYANAPESYSVGANYNLIEVTDNTDTFYTQPQLTQTYLGSFFFTAGNQRPVQENQLLMRSTLFAGISTTNNEFYTTPDNELREVDIPISVGIQGSKALTRYLGALGQLSWQKVQEDQYSDSSRGSLNGSIGPPLIRVFRGTDLFLRADGGTLFGQGNDYTWYRGIVGVTGLITPKIRLSSAYYSSEDTGTPPMPFDEVPPGEGFTFRGDLSMRKWFITAMNQYDTSRDDWTRFQLYVAFRDGIIQPFVGFDQRANSYTFGLKAFFGETITRFTGREVTGIKASQ